MRTEWLTWVHGSPQFKGYHICTRGTTMGDSNPISDTPNELPQEYEEIGGLLGCSAASARKAASRAKPRLRRLFEEEADDATA